MIYILCYGVLGAFVYFGYLVWQRNGEACLNFIDLVALVSTMLALPRLFSTTYKDPRNVRLAIAGMELVYGWMGWTHSYVGVENIDKITAIVVCNHQTSLDIMPFLSMTRVTDRVSFVIKKELWYKLPFGIFMHCSGSVFVDRSKSSEAYKLIEDNIKDISRFEGTKFVFLAEGTRNFEVMKTRKLLPFKKGAFRMAIKCQLPIIPLVYSPHYFYDRDKNYFGPGEVIGKFLPAIETKGMTEEHVNDLMDRVQQLMQKTFDEFLQQICPIPNNQPASS